jgi:2-polyprenyl-3-methyl-5-hydroxy-6-metoxy-1,4-benzoquinol methylase
MWLAERSTADEIMDDAGQTEEAFRTALKNLEWLSKVTFGYRPTLSFLDRVVKETGATRLSILDVGAGGGDMLRKVAAWGAKRGVDLDLTGLDISPWAERHALAQGTPAAWITGDLFDLPEDRRFDLVLCSLFAHHLREPELIRFLQWLEHHAARAWLISDIHRHWIAWAGVWALVRVVRMDPMVVHDSTVSIARGFVRADWERAMEAAGVAAELRWAVPFRWTLTRIR